MLMVQVVMNCYIKDPDGFDRDLREIGADWVLLSMAVLICNIWPDPIEAPVLETDGNWTPVETVNAESAADGNLVRLSRIESFGYAAVLLQLESL